MSDENEEETIVVDGALTITKGDPDWDWYCIERAAHDGREWLEPTPHGSAYMRSARISDADVEGDSAAMLAVAHAIEMRDSYSEKRCGVAVDGDKVRFWSPRNSQHAAVVSLAAADALAKHIRATVVAPVPS